VVTATKAIYKSGAIERRRNVSPQNATAGPEPHRSLFARRRERHTISFKDRRGGLRIQRHCRASPPKTRRKRICRNQPRPGHYLLFDSGKRTAAELKSSPMIFTISTGARRSPTRAVVRAARQQGGNSGSARRTRRLTYSGARRQDHDTRRSAPGSSLPRYGHADSS
jgi:hypothetical protein